MPNLDLAAVLAEINKIRKNVGRKPRRQICRGNKADIRSCPIARSIGRYAAAGEFHYWIDSRSLSDAKDTPEVLARFIRAFDSGKLPQFERKGGK